MFGNFGYEEKQFCQLPSTVKLLRKGMSHVNQLMKLKISWFGGEYLFAFMN